MGSGDLPFLWCMFKLFSLMLLLIILFGSPRCSEFLWLSFLAEPLSQINPNVEYDHSRELAKKILMLLPLEMSYGSHLEP